MVTDMDELYPIVKQMAPNEEQLPAILARGRDVVVTAGAGTGKTRTLVARYLSLLADGLPLRSIVAITFTRKAAQEMRNRVRKAIRLFLDQPDLSVSARRQWDVLYNELDAARIDTIHTLSTEILRAHPAEARIDPRFDVLDEGQAGILLAQVVDETMAWAADDVEAVQLFALLREWSLRNMLTDMLARRLEVVTAFENLPRDPWTLWMSLLLEPIRQFVEDERVHRDFNDLIAIRDDGSVQRAAEAGDRLVEPLLSLLSLWDEIVLAQTEQDWAAVSRRLQPLRQNMKLVGSKKAWAPADPKAIIKELQELYDEQLAPLVGSGGIDLGLDRQLVEATPALRRMFDQALNIYSQLKQDGQLLDFDDLEDGALRLLRDYPAVRQRWQKEISAILVDEYQDTNDRQRTLVNLINGDGGKLFIVGDAKQSIYRFRGADVAVFRSERTRIEASGGSAYTLAKSYRAHRDLIHVLNHLLRSILDETEYPERPWREPFAPLLHHREEAANNLIEPFVELHLTVGSKADGALHRAAGALTGRLSELHENGFGYEEMAIICRASTSFGPYEDALDRAGIPYLTVAGRGFFDRPEIRDLLNALQALSDPTDNLALVGLLRSPVFAFSDADLYDLCRSWIEAEKGNPLWPTLSKWSGEKAGRAVKIIDDLNRRAGRTPVARLLKLFLDETDYRAALRRAGHPRAARNVSKLLADAHTSGLVGVREFLEYVNGLRSGAAREGEARAMTEEAVKIMSVHAAKGLEFPIIIIGDINYGRPATIGLLIDSELGVLPRLANEDGALAGIYRISQEREIDQEAAESDRLLYVASTRAKELLILSGTIKLSANGRPGWLKGWLKALNEPLQLSGLAVEYDEAGQDAHRFDLTAGESRVGCTIYDGNYQSDAGIEPLTEEIPSNDAWQPLLLSPVIGEEEKIQEAEFEPRVWRVVPAAERPRAPAWIVGKVVHEALAVWRFPDQGFAAWAEARARGYGLLDYVQLHDASRRTARLLQQFKRHSLFAEMDAAEQRLHEVPYSYQVNGRTENGVIDVLYRVNDRWKLVEFKTDHLRNSADLNRVLEDNYTEQIKRYITAVVQISGQRPEANLCFLDYQGHVYRKTI
jgi:ATP-dependent helicase/nuclease subunit A